MKKILLLCALISSLTILTDETCLEHYRRTRLGSNSLQTVAKPCYCNCSQARAQLNKKQYRGRCPICKHFHVPSEIKYKNQISVLR